MIRVAVSGAAGRMGSTTCAAVEGADDMELVARIDPSLGVALALTLPVEARPTASGAHPAAVTEAHDGGE